MRAPNWSTNQLGAKTWSILWLIAVAISGGACDGGGSDGVVSCTTAAGASGGACDGGGSDGAVSCPTAAGTEVKICQELPASYRPQLQQICSANPAMASAGASITFTDGPCSHVNALGGCKVTNGSLTVTEWWYQDTGPDSAGGTPADIQKICAGIQGTYVAP
jgi:hypothetical protein